MQWRHGQGRAHRSQIASLTPEELASFRQWYASFDSDAWDRQIEADLKAGKLDALMAEAQAELEAGKAREL
jgi:hypothetical protein